MRGSPSASTGSMQGPMALTATASMARASTPESARSSWRMATRSAHQSSSRPVFGPARPGHQHRVPAVASRPPVPRIDDDALGLVRADIDAERVAHGARTSSSPA